ncbi:MAG: 4-hydroxybenzoate 3-monooxygenase [Woeseiaceae bacterium]|nr:4-hydroxybenzoate 3-monooxygenase [Woeseiaceae bacterium]
MKTQVAIIGAGPAGLMLGHLLHNAGIDTLVIENKSRNYIEERVRAGVLEQGTVNAMVDSGVGERLLKEGLQHDYIDLRFNREPHRLNVKELSRGRCVWVYAQHEIIKDLVAARLSYDEPLLFEVGDVEIRDIDTDRPSLRFVHEGIQQVAECDFVAGCDGFHGISRTMIPESELQVYDRQYPFAWLGVLAEAPPASDMIIYAYHERGFALQSMRGPNVSRLYVQCPVADTVEGWSDERFWRELHARLDINGGWHQQEGPIFQKGITGMRSFVCEPMQYGRLMLAGDAAHIVPPTGAKGLNMAIGDVQIMTRALNRYYKDNKTDYLERYSDTCLKRVWQVQRFASMLCYNLHRFPEHNQFEHKMQLAELNNITHSKQAMRAFAQNYTGIPVELFYDLD